MMTLSPAQIETLIRGLLRALENPADEEITRLLTTQTLPILILGILGAPIGADPVVGSLRGADMIVLQEDNLIRVYLSSTRYISFHPLERTCLSEEAIGWLVSEVVRICILSLSMTASDFTLPLHLDDPEYSLTVRLGRRFINSWVSICRTSHPFLTRMKMWRDICKNISKSRFNARAAHLSSYSTFLAREVNPDLRLRIRAGQPNLPTTPASLSDMSSLFDDDDPDLFVSTFSAVQGLPPPT